MFWLRARELAVCATWPGAGSSKMWSSIRRRIMCVTRVSSLPEAAAISAYVVVPVAGTKEGRRKRIAALIAVVANC